MERPPAGQRTGSIDGELTILVPPRSDSVQILEAESERIHLRMAGSAFRILAMRFHLLPKGSRLANLGIVERRHRGRRRWRRGVEEILEYPLAAQHGRGPGRVGRNGQDAGLRQYAAAALGQAHIHSTKLRPRDSGNSVKPGEPLV